jgi:membrane complex biogenesis BtpA family protein
MVAEIFQKPKPILGPVHLLPLPGAPQWDGQWERLTARAEQEATALATGGVDALIVENYSDGPFSVTMAAADPAAAIATALLIKRLHALTGLPVGLSWLANDPATALAIAVNADVAFVRLAVSTGARLSQAGLLNSRFQELIQAQARLKTRLPFLLADVTVDHLVPRPVAIEADAQARRHTGTLNHLIDIAQNLPIDLPLAIVLNDADCFPEELATFKNAVIPPVFIENASRNNLNDAYFTEADGLILNSGIRKNLPLEAGQRPTIEMTRVEEIVNRLRGVKSVLDMDPEVFLQR